MGEGEAWIGKEGEERENSRKFSAKSKAGVFFLVMNQNVPHATLFTKEKKSINSSYDEVIFRAGNSKSTSL